MATKTVVGLDLGSTHVRGAELELRSNGEPGRVLRYGEVPLSGDVIAEGQVVDPVAASAAVHELWHTTKFATKHAVVGVANQRVVVRDIELPAAPIAEIKASLAYTVQDELPVAVEDSYLDFLPLRRAGQNIAGLLVAAPRDLVEGAVDVLMRCHLQPEGVDLAAFGLVRGVTRGALGPGVCGIVDVGATLTTIVVAVDGHPERARFVASGGRLVTETLSRHLAIPGREAERLKLTTPVRALDELPEAMRPASHVLAERCQALAESVGATFNYHQQNGGAPVERIVLTGRATLMDGLAQYLSTALRLPTFFASPDRDFDLAPDVARMLDDDARQVLPVSLGLAVGANS